MLDQSGQPAVDRPVSLEAAAASPSSAKASGGTRSGFAVAAAAEAEAADAEPLSVRFSKTGFSLGGRSELPLSIPEEAEHTQALSNEGAATLGAGTVVNI